LAATLIPGTLLTGGILHGKMKYDEDRAFPAAFIAALILTNVVAIMAFPHLGLAALTVKTTTLFLASNVGLVMGGAFITASIVERNRYR
jgi:hypothetical protein